MEQRKVEKRINEQEQIKRLKEKIWENKMEKIQNSIKNTNSLRTI